jgi:quercetin dioxygenase-like cupin family protein
MYGPTAALQELHVSVQGLGGGGAGAGGANGSASALDLDPPFQPLTDSYTLLLPHTARAAELVIGSTRDGDSVTVDTSGCNALVSKDYRVTWRRGAHMWRARYGLRPQRRPCWLRVHVFTSEAAASGGDGADGGGDEDAPAGHGAEEVIPPLAGRGLVRKRSLSGVRAWQLPNATNRLALLVGPQTDPGMSLTFGVEMFEPGHRTTRHIHTAAFEMFIVLGGEGVGINNKEAVPLRAGDVAVFPPHVVHAIDNPSSRRLYCLQMMLPNDMFAEYVTSGSLLGPLDRDDMAGIITGTC